MTLYTEQSSNITKTWLLMAVFLVVVVAIGYGIAWYLNDPSILYAAILFAFVMNIGSYWFSDSVVITLTGAHAIDLQNPEHRELARIIENLAITAGLPMPKVYIVDDPAPNAFATGRDPHHAVLAVTSGLLPLLERTELEGVLAHELGHIGNRDMLVSTVAVVLAGFVAILADLFTRTLWWGGGERDERERNPLLLIIGLLGILLAPLAAQLLQLAISRKREYLADATGALLTRYPEGLARALEKISTYGRPMIRANTATAHLFIADPFGGDDEHSMGMRIAGLFQTHPPAADRIRRLRSSL